MMKILIVEDEKKLNQMISDYLLALEYSVKSTYDGISAIKLFKDFSPDLVLLDWLLPGIDGMDVVRKIRETHLTPIILLTAKAEETDKLFGLDGGADDYITKPFSMKELAARIRAVLRRGTGYADQDNSQHGEAVSSGEIVLDGMKRKVLKRGREVFLTSVQFEILKFLMKQPGRVYTRSEILNSIQDQRFEGYERTIDVHIKNIRKTLEDIPSRPVYIITVWGVGYKFAEEMEKPE